MAIKALGLRTAKNNWSLDLKSDTYRLILLKALGARKKA